MSSSKKYSNGFWKVYVHINKINNKRYVGITSQKVEYRWNDGRGYKSSPHFWSAIVKYGWDNFEHIVLFDELCEEEAKEKEIELIKLWNTQDNKCGYNSAAGGDGAKGYKPTEEATRKRVAKILGSKRSEETRRRMSESTSLTRPDVMKKSAEAKYKPVMAYTLDDKFVGFFSSIVDAAKTLGLSSSGRRHISDCCKGNRKSAGGYKWAYI